ncbi:Type II secretion envelope pseudopilin protein (PulG,guides folded protein to PulD in outer membrane) [hydrothermal vent metagenome]|uniref:Type II secretion envelope pseudopilin protein (PulG,guides folded protein to PulD in outer membrane) n=1 Tax=hydrothermal vent metagenome TaxID=652676 RepID=A0A1W1BTA4_9ZZZZ
MKNRKSAFTMIELVFVIVIIGILAAVAVPRLSTTRDDAIIVKAKTTVASVRNALAMERQKRILRGKFTPITAVGGTNTGVFGNFDDNTSQPMVLEYAEPSSSNNGGWQFITVGGTDTYRFNCRALGGNVDFNVTNGRFICDDTTNGCQQLTR